jgi:hypothetical protein
MIRKSAFSPRSPVACLMRLAWAIGRSEAEEGGKMIETLVTFGIAVAAPVWLLGEELVRRLHLRALSNGGSTRKPQPVSTIPVHHAA